MKKITKQEMIDTVLDWIDCLEESTREADGRVHDRKILRELAILKEIQRLIHNSKNEDHCSN